MLVLEYLLTNGPTLAVGVSLVLVVACVAVGSVRSPAERRRLGALAACAVLLYLGAGIVPMPRLAFPPVRAPQSAPAVTLSTPAPRPVPASMPRAIVPPSDPELLLLVPAPKPAAVERAMKTPPPRLAPAGWLAVAFLVGSSATALWLLLGSWRLWRLVRRCQPAPAWLADAVAVPVLLTESRTRAFCAGLWRPVVVLPRDLATPARAPAARAVLAHELAHVRAGDCRVQMLFALLLPLCWWQPLFWWLRERVRFASELLADDAAARQSSIPAYARELLQLVEAGHARVAHAGALSVFHRPSEFYLRIQMLLSRQAPLSRSVPLRRRLAGAVGALTMVTIAAGFCGVGRAQAPPTTQSREAAELQETVRELRAEVEALRKQLEARRGEGTLGRLLQDEAVERIVDDVAAAHAKAPTAPDSGSLVVGSDAEILRYLSRVNRLSQPSTYTVREGDSLATIARKHLGDPRAVDRLLACNPDLVDPRALRVGQEIVLPPRTAPAPDDAGSPVPEADVPPSPRPAGGAVADRSLTDLLNVVTRCIELRGQVELAEFELAHLSDLDAQAVVDRHAVRVAQIKLTTLHRQVQLTERLLKSELASAKGEMERLEKLREAGMLSDGDARLRRVGTFLEVLSGFF